MKTHGYAETFPPQSLSLIEEDKHIADGTNHIILNENIAASQAGVATSSLQWATIAGHKQLIHFKLSLLY